MDYKETTLELVTDEDISYESDGERIDEVCSRFSKIKRTVISTIISAPFTISVCIIQVICFCMENEFLVDRLCFAPDKREQFWRSVTYAFLHSNLYHLIPNLFFLLLAGILLEHDQGTLRAFIVYTTGIVSGAFGCNIFHKPERVIGTSAASYSMLLSHVVHLKLNWKIVRFKDYRMIIVFCLCFGDIVSFFLASFFFKNVLVSWSSHFFSSVNGLLISSIIFRSNKPCHLLRYFTIAIYTALMTYSFIIYMPWILNNICRYSSYDYLNSELRSVKKIQSRSVSCVYRENC